jgi:hypothetical protein
MIKAASEVACAVCTTSKLFSSTLATKTGIVSVDGFSDYSQAELLNSGNGPAVFGSYPTEWDSNELVG